MNLWEMLSILVRAILVMSATGSVLVIILFALKSLIKERIPKSVQYYLWSLVLVVMLVPFSTFLYVPASTPMAPIQEIIDGNIKTTVERQEEFAQERYKMPYNALEPSEQVEISYNEIGLINGMANNYLLVTMIMIGLFVFLLELSRYFTFVLKLKRSRRVAKENEIQLLSQLCSNKKTPRLYITPLAPTPMLIGIFHPVIYLPDGEYSEIQLRNILLHELVHLRRHDVIVKWITALTVHVHWFNPFAYFVRREIDRACELACDETVIKNLNISEKQSYGDTLIAVVADKKLPKTVVSTTMCEEKKALKERLDSIMKHKGFSVVTMVISCFLLITVMCGAVTLGAGSVNNITVPTVSIYNSSSSSVPLKADMNTGIIYLPASVDIRAGYRGNASGSSILIYCATSLDVEPLLLASVRHDATSPDNVKIIATWNVAQEYPNGFNGYVWAVVNGSNGTERVSPYLRAVYE